MPELPEVETVRRGLAPVLEGVRVAHVDVRRSGLRWPFPPRMGERISGKVVERLDRRSKYLLGHLDSGETLILHLGMSGRLTVTGAPVGEFHHAMPVPEKHDHVVFHLEGGGRVAFNDARRFGVMDLWPTDDIDGHRLLASLGPEPLGNEFSAAYLASELARRKSPVKSVLLDQRVVAGLGNIYVCEALWLAHIPPMCLAREIGGSEAFVLFDAIRSVLADAIEAGGSSLRDFRHADGDLGYFQHNFAVYGREGEACRMEGCGGTIARVVQSGRSSFYCPQCQARA